MAAAAAGKAREAVLWFIGVNYDTSDICKAWLFFFCPFFSYPVAKSCLYGCRQIIINVIYILEKKNILPPLSRDCNYQELCRGRILVSVLGAEIFSHFKTTCICVFTVVLCPFQKKTGFVYTYYMTQWELVEEKTGFFSKERVTEFQSSFFSQFLFNHFF